MPFRRSAAIVALAAALASCTPEEKHRILTVFFDGVPPLYPPQTGTTTQPAGRAVAGAGEPSAAPAPAVYEHRPGTNRNACTACHNRDTSYGLVKPIEDLCLSCHEKETRAFPRMHGPVAAGECGACHEPHESRYPHLVLEPVPPLCFRCHEPAPSGGEATAGCPRPSDEADCRACHRPHGGEDRFFLVTRSDAHQGTQSAGTAASERGAPRRDE